MKRIAILLLVCMSNGWLFANHWMPNDSNFEDNMTLTGVIQINGIEQQSTMLEVGVFCGEECRGTGLPTYFFPTQRYVIQLLVFGESGDQLTFRLYDHESGQELSLTSPDAVAFISNGYGSLSNPYVLNFTGSWNHWVPNDSSYEDNMTLTGVIQIDGVEQQSTTLEVGVFCGEECRAIGYPTYFFPTQRYVIQLLIFGETGDQLTFKLYDHAIGQELNLTSPEAVTFVSNGYGSLGNPYVLNFTGASGEITPIIQLSEGWNWFSTCVEVDDPVAMLNMLKAGLGDNGVRIESNTLSMEYLGAGQWFGDLNDEGITNEQMYLIETSAECTVELHGMPACPANHTILINHGWNWIGFPSSESISLTDALAAFVAEEGDLIECSDDSAVFFDGGWIGMETLTPGRGYLYYSNSTEQKTLTFQTSRGTGAN